MAHNLYITGAEPDSGKSLIALAVMEILTGSAERVGVFRPVVREGPDSDPLLQLITTRYQLDYPSGSLYGVDLETARRLLDRNRYDELLRVILDKFSTLSACCERVLCIGTDISGSGGMLEFDFNVDVANNLGCLLVPVVRGKDRTPREVADAASAFLKSLQDRDSDIALIVVNRVTSSDLAAAGDELQRRLGSRVPVYVVPEEPLLGKPTMRDIVRALGARVYPVAEDCLDREVRDFKVAAMSLPDFLPHIEEGSLIITPGDRADILLGSIISYTSRAYPAIAGILLTGGQEPAPPVMKLITGLGNPLVPVIGVETDTFTTAVNVSRVTAALTAGDSRKVAAGLGAVEQSIDLGSLRQRLQAVQSARVTPFMFEHELIQRARARRMRIVLPEALDERILRATEMLRLRDVVAVVLLGDPRAVRARIGELGLTLDNVEIVDPFHSEHRELFAQTYYDLRRHKGISRDMAFDAMADVNYFATMMVHHGQVDGMVSGAVHTTQQTVRPAFEIIRTRPGTSIVSSVFLMCLEDRVLVYGDCAINPDPTAEQLADIAISSAATARMFGIEPRVAMLSYSTGESGKGVTVDKVARATAMVRNLQPALLVEGPLQYDAAVDPDVARLKLPGSQVRGQATVFVFPDLNTGNNTYKAVQRSANAVAIGPVLQGLNRPVNDLSRGCTVADIVNTVAITAIQARDDGA